MIYLYAITDRTTDRLPAVSGIAGSPLLQIVHQETAAITSILTGSDLGPEATRVWQHEQVIEAMMEDRAVLPLRFGTLLADEAAVRDTLAARYDEFVNNLRFVAGRVEVGLRVLCYSANSATLGEDGEAADQQSPANDADIATALSSGSLLTTSGGRAYMMARLAAERALQRQQQRVNALADSIHAPLARLAVAYTSRTLATQRLILAAAYLVEREQIDQFRQAIAELSAAHPSLRFLGTGPWPAYHFVMQSNRKQEYDASFS
jgi:hypothetical protein